MSKILVEVYVPAARLKYDAYIPAESKIGEVGLLLSNAISDLSKGQYRENREATICNFSTGKEYNKNLRVFETDIDNGSKIMIT